MIFTTEARRARSKKLLIKSYSGLCVLCVYVVNFLRSFGLTLLRPVAYNSNVLGANSSSSASFFLVNPCSKEKSMIVSNIFRFALTP